MPSRAISLRPAEPDDCALVWRWRNDEETRRASLDSSPIEFDTHRGWFADTLQRTDRQIRIVMVDGVPGGVVRLDIAGDEAEVSIHLAPGWRGRGIGTVALRKLAVLGLRTLRLSKLSAFVKADNAASLAAFRKAGFSQTAGGAVIALERPGR